MMYFYISYNISTSKAKMLRSAHPKDRDLFPSPEKRQANVFKLISKKMFDQVWRRSLVKSRAPSPPHDVFMVTASSPVNKQTP